MSFDYDDLEDRVQRLVRATKSKSKVKVIPIAGDGSLSAHINLDHKGIEFQIPVEWDPEKYENIKKFVRKDQLEEKSVGLQLQFMFQGKYSDAQKGRFKRLFKNALMKLQIQKKL